MTSNRSFEKFGNYLLLERIAAGGMAAVYLARPADHAANGRLLAIKRILPHAAADPDFQRMFQTEIQVCMGFNHPNIVHLHDFGRVDGHPYIAMEYVEGRTLRQIVAKYTERNLTMPVPVAISVIAQSAAALHYAHTAKNRLSGEPLNVIHRDVSPQNILVSYDGNVKLIDFGIARSELDSLEHTRTGTGSIKGKVCYLSPEQARRDKLDPRTDVFSLGVVLWELLTGQKLFTMLGRGDVEVIMMISQCEKHVKPPSQVNPRVPAELDAIVLKALRSSPEDRYPTAAEFQSALRTFLLQRYEGFSYGDVALAMRESFATEELQDRQKVQELNASAQALLTEFEQNHSRTTILPPPSPGAGTSSSEATNFLSPGFPLLPLQGESPTSRSSLGQSSSRASGYTSGGAAWSAHSSSFTPSAVSMPSQPSLPPLPSVVATPEEPKKPLFSASTRTKVLFGILYLSTIWLLRVDREYMLFDRFFLPSEYVRMASIDARAVSATPNRSAEVGSPRSPQAPSTPQEDLREAARQLAEASRPTAAPVGQEHTNSVPKSQAPHEASTAASVATSAAQLDAQPVHLEPVSSGRRSPASHIESGMLQLAITPLPLDPRAIRVWVNGRSVQLHGASVEVPLHQSITLRVEQPSTAPFETRFKLEPPRGGRSNFRLDVAMRRSTSR